MDERSDDDDIVKVEMQDIYPAGRQPAELCSNEHLNMSSRRLTDTGRQFDHVSSMADQNAISVEQRAAAIMDRIKQLYYIDDDPERKEFLDDYFEFMRKRDATVTRIPTMAKQPLDLFKLYRTVVSLGGLTEVVRNRHWSKVTRELNLPSSITSAAFTLRTQYLRFLYAYECFQKGVEEQPWKLEDCDDLSNGSFRATQASPSSFVDNRTCPNPRDMRGEQRHSPQWAEEQQLVCSSYGPRPPYAHVHSQMNIPERGPIPNGFVHSMDIRCPELARQGTKMPPLTNGHAFESRGPLSMLSSNITSSCDCGKNSCGYESPCNVNQPNTRKTDESRHSSLSERQETREETNSKDGNNKDENLEMVSTSVQNQPQDICMKPSVSQERSLAVCNPSQQTHVPIPGETSKEIGSGCSPLQNDINRHYCQSNKEDHHENPLREHMGRIPLHMNNALPPSALHPSRSPYCNPRKRPRFYSPNGPPNGGCGCGRGEVLESSDPITFKVHYRTEQRVFVTVQFGKRMYLGELFAEELE